MHSRANFTDIDGNLVATLANPAVDTGLITSSGIFYPEAILVLRWAVDQQLAYVRSTGVGYVCGSVAN